MSKGLEDIEIIRDRFVEYKNKAEGKDIKCLISPQFAQVRKELEALKLVKTKSKKNYNLALVVDSGTYEQYCEQFKYFLDDYKENCGAFEIWEEDKFSFEEYNLLREVFVYE